MENRISRKEVLQCVLSGLLGISFVAIMFFETEQGLSINGFWLAGGFILGIIFVLFRWLSRIGKQLHDFLNQSFTVRLLSVVISLLSLILILNSIKILSNPVWLSGLLGFSFRFVLAVGLYLRR